MFFAVERQAVVSSFFTALMVKKMQEKSPFVCFWDDPSVAKIFCSFTRIVETVLSLPSRLASRETELVGNIIWLWIVVFRHFTFLDEDCYIYPTSDG